MLYSIFKDEVKYVLHVKGMRFFRVENHILDNQYRTYLSESHQLALISLLKRVLMSSRNCPISVILDFSFSIKIKKKKLKICLVDGD